jgi:2-desacetyl-2-hydroxyethyl bacteriochlorophyllide A dehydrogenase
MPRKLKLNAPRQIDLIPYEERPLKGEEIRARAVLSGISHGTEMNLYRGTSPFNNQHFDTDMRLFQPGAESTDYSDYLGYEWVGRVTETGSQVQHLQVGDLIHMPLPHSETHTFIPQNVPNWGRIEALPPEVLAENAVCLALAGVALQAVHDAKIKVGDRVAIFGMGVIGLLTVQLARLTGAAWIDAVDLFPLRRKLALTFGADRALDPGVCDVGYEIKTISPERGADVAIEVSGHYSALHEAIRSARKSGTVVAAGYYQGGGTALRLGEEWHHNRITMVSSMAVWDNPHRDYPAWDRIRINASVTDLMATGRLRTDGLITHRIPFSRAHEAYELIDANPADVVKVVLTYD